MSLIVEILAGIAFSIVVTITLLAIVFLLVLGVGKLVVAIQGRSRTAKPTGPSDFGRLRGRMKRAETTTLLLVPAKSPGFSKLGGAPALPVGVVWPQSTARSSYAFLAQIDLAVFRAHAGPDWLPIEGRLYAFVDEDRNGFADLVRVIFATESPGPERDAPPNSRVFPERRVAFETYPSRPSLDWLDVDFGQLNLSEAELDTLAEAPDESFGDEIQHRIGGYPCEIQGGQMQVECERMRRGLPDDLETTDAIRRASKQWRMLLQVDSDPALKMNWGDGGRLYVFVRDTDARSGDFTRTVTVSQCH